MLDNPQLVFLTQQNVFREILTILQSPLKLLKQNFVISPLKLLIPQTMQVLKLCKGFLRNSYKIANKIVLSAGHKKAN